MLSSDTGTCGIRFTLSFTLARSQPFGKELCGLRGGDCRLACSIFNRRPGRCLVFRPFMAFDSVLEIRLYRVYGWVNLSICFRGNLPDWRSDKGMRRKSAE